MKTPIDSDNPKIGGNNLANRLQELAIAGDHSITDQQEPKKPTDLDKLRAKYNAHRSKQEGNNLRSDLANKKLAERKEKSDRPTDNQTNENKPPLYSGIKRRKGRKK